MLIGARLGSWAESSWRASGLAFRVRATREKKDRTSLMKSECIIMFGSFEILMEERGILED